VTRFVFIGGAPAVDFVNTEVVAGGERVDLLQREEDLWEWLGESPLAPLAGRGWREAPGEGPLLPQAKQLRAQLRAMFLRGKAQKNHIEAINAALRRGEGSLALVKKDGAWGTQFEARSGDPLFLIAAAAADFLSHRELSLVKSCEGSGCILLFHDETKSHSRRWCSMAGCGNRMKAALHYRRRKIGGP
jgi:predicted RNA-binding Zn ribbon-like protein